MKFLSTAALLTLGLGAMFPTMAQTVTIQSLRQQKNVVVSGTVGSVVGNSFTLSDGHREIVVDAGSHWHQHISLSPGEQLSVEGEFGDNKFDAQSITRSSGEVIAIRRSRGRSAWAGSLTPLQRR
ncbi:DNA-binding protein [Nodosilinea sp. LEGE 07298]|nr:DNA-binding protein [Nodosilinea sp. LEGE 07298]